MHPRRDELDEAVRGDDLDLVLSLASLDEIADAWLANDTRGPAGSDHPDDWAREFFHCPSLVGRPELFREAILTLLARADDDQLGSIGAGPLECYFNDDDDDLRWMAQQARTNERFRVALSFLTHMSPASLRRLVNDGQWRFDPPISGRSEG